MSVLSIALGLLIPGGGLVWAVAKFGAGAVFGGIGKKLKAAAGWAADHWRVVLPVVIAAAAVVYILILRGDLRHERKINGQQAALITAVKREVDLGVGKPTEAADAPFYIKRFVGNVLLLDRKLGEQNKALAIAKDDANRHDDDAHAASQPTQAQGQRQRLRATIADPHRTTGLSADEWGKL